MMSRSIYSSRAIEAHATKQDKSHYRQLELHEQRKQFTRAASLACANRKFI
jgi:hypothetical protein